MEDKATVRPWNINEERKNEIDAQGIECFIECYGTETKGESRANAKLIVKAVNNYDDLVEALKESQKILDIYVNGGNPNSIYKEGNHGYYVLGSMECLDKTREILSRLEKS